MRSCSGRPIALPRAPRPMNSSKVSARFSKNAGRISRERGSREKSTSSAMDRAARRGERRPVVRMLLLSLRLLAVGLSALSLRGGLSVRGGYSLSAGTGGGAAIPATTGTRIPATAGTGCWSAISAAAGSGSASAVKRTGSASAAAARAAIIAQKTGAPAPQADLEGTQERHQILFLRGRQLGAEDQVEELNRVLQGQQTLGVQVGRIVLGAAQRKGFDRPVPDGHHIVDHHRLEEALGLEVVHQIVGVERRLVASRALTLAEEDLLAVHLGLCRLGGIELTEDVELGRGGKVQHLLKIGHEVDLAAALEWVHSLLSGLHDIAVEIGGALLEFGEVLDRLQRPLRADQPLNV